MKIQTKLIHKIIKTIRMKQVQVGGDHRYLEISTKPRFYEVKLF